MKQLRWLASAAGIALLGATLPERWFSDVTQKSGVAHRHTNRLTIVGHQLIELLL